MGHHFDASLLIRGHWGHPTGHLGTQILIFVDFCSILGSPGDPLGSHFADFVLLLSHLVILMQAFRAAFFLISDWKSCQDPVLECAQNLVNTDVLDRFHFFHFFVNFESSRLDFSDF